MEGAWSQEQALYHDTKRTLEELAGQRVMVPMFQGFVTIQYAIPLVTVREDSLGHTSGRECFHSLIVNGRVLKGVRCVESAT